MSNSPIRMREKGENDAYDVGIVVPGMILVIVFRFTGVQRKIRTHLDLLSIPQLGGGKCQNV